MDLAQELAAREVTAYRIAKEAGLTPSGVYAIAAGLRRGRPATRRRLAVALRQFPVVEPEETDVHPA